MVDCSYSFKRDAKVYIVYAGAQYRIDISAISFGQTFTEYSYSNKTLQVENMFEQSVINKANPANFQITFPAIREDDFAVLFNRSIDYQSFDLYVETKSDVFKIRNCIISNAAFVIETLRPLSMEVTGEASRVTRLGDYGTTIPGTTIARSSNMTYNRISDLSVLLGGTYRLSESLSSITVELQNNITWTPYTTVQGALIAENADSSMYPEAYTLSKRILAGTITNYLHDNYDNLLQWDTDTSLHITVGQDVGGTTYGFDIDISNCSFTNRVEPNNIFTQSYDWRMTQNPNSLHQVITYIRLADASGAILDSWGLAILDSSGQPLLEST